MLSTLFYIGKVMKTSTKKTAWAWYLTPVIPALSEAKVGGSLEVRSSGQAWPTGWNPISTKNTKVSCAWWWVPVVLATQEVEAQESLEPGRQRLQWAEIRPLHSSLGNRARLFLKNKKQKASPWLLELVSGYGAPPHPGFFDIILYSSLSSICCSGAQEFPLEGLD